MEHQQPVSRSSDTETECRSAYTIRVFDRLRTCLFLALIIGIVSGCSPREGVAEQRTPEKAQAAQPSPKEIPAGMILIPAATFKMGSEDGRSDEQPVHEVTVSSFAIDAHLVTNDDFAKFVEATKYKTTAEIPPDPKDFPGADPAKLVPGSLVFLAGKWDYLPGANWQHPEGPKSDLKGKGNHPVVQVSWYDASAYAKWVHKDLPTEAEYEWAARSGQEGKEFTWGDAPYDPAHPQVNSWQGDFPTKNLNTDGYLTTSPIGAFKPNSLGLFDISGNVWEWCADWYRPDAYANSARVDPKGPSSSFDPDEPDQQKRVLRGGSFLCAECYCRGYRVASRMKSSQDSGSMHVGFRCVKRFK